MNSIGRINGQRFSAMPIAKKPRLPIGTEERKRGEKMRAIEDQSLNQRWYKMKKRDHAPEWDDPSAFEKWAVENGWKRGYRLCKLVYNAPIGPDNCRVIPQCVKEEDKTDETLKNWNRTVNIWRKHFGLPMFDE